MASLDNAPNGLEPLVKGAIYLVQLSDCSMDPKVLVRNSDNSPAYFGFVKKSLHPNPEVREAENRVRFELLNGDSTSANARVIGTPHRSITGPYKFVGTDEVPPQDYFNHKDMTYLFEGDVVQVRYVGRGPQGDPKFVAKEQGKPMMGFFDRYSRRISGSEMEVISEIRPKISMGQNLIARMTYSDGNTYFFMPALSITERDNVRSIDGKKRIVTHSAIEDHNSGMVYNLPILYAVQSTSHPSEMLGVGFIRKRPKKSSPSSWKPVVIKGAAGNIGDIVREAEVRIDGTVVLAQKIR